MELHDQRMNLQLSSNVLDAATAAGNANSETSADLVSMRLVSL